MRRDGGRVTDSFDPSLLPPGALPSPGAIRYLDRGLTVRPPNQAAAIGTPRLDYVPIQDDGDGVHEGRVLYINQTTGAYEPLSGVLLRVETFDGYEGRYTGTYVYATTDSTGFFAIECPWTGGVERYDGFVELDDGTVAVDHYQGPYFGLCGDNDIIVGSNPGRVYANMQATITASRALLQKSRGRILVYIGSGSSRYE